MVRLSICLMFLAWSSKSDAAITLNLSPPEYGPCGQVRINGGVIPTSGTITRLSWDWGDGTIIDSFFEGVHTYSRNGAYEIHVTAYSNTGETQTTRSSVTISNAEDPTCKFSPRLHPATVFLRNGRTSQALRLEIRDDSGKLLPSAGQRVRFESKNPALVQVSSSGVVTSKGFGETDVEVFVEGGRSAKAKVIAGHFRVTPPLLMLSMDKARTGRVSIDIANADGSPVDLTGLRVSFAFDGKGKTSNIASIDDAGLVTTIRPLQVPFDTASARAFVENLDANSSTIIRVLPNDQDLKHIQLDASNITFYILEKYGSFNYVQIFNDNDVLRITNLAYQLEQTLMGLRPFRGDLQYLANEPGPPGTEPCGGSGNPARFGTRLGDDIHNSCLIVAFPPAVPQWFVFFHELGHNFTFGSQKFSQFALASPVQGSNSAYVEGLASAMGVYAARRMREVTGQYGIPQSILTEILKQNWWRPTQKPDLDRYVANGSRYSSIDANIIDDMVVALADQSSTGALYRFYSVFLPSDSQYSFAIDSDAKQATFFVAAWSAAAGEDLRSRFRQSWGFPVDDAYYASISSEVGKLVSQRDPGAYAGKNIEVPVGQNVMLSEAEGFDWEGDALRFSWKILSQPSGSVASVSDASALHPMFRADRPGQYVLSLTASDGLLTGSASTMTIDVKPAVQPQTFSWILPSSARAVGAIEGVFYTTDLTVANTGPTDAAITLKFLGNNQDGRTGIEKNVQLAAGKSVTYLDVLRSVFNLELDYRAVQIRSSVAELAILSRTSTPGGGGSFGQSVPAFASGDTIAQGSRRSILGIREDGKFRTNLVLSNATENGVSIQVALTSQEGQILGTKEYSVAPLGMVQVSGLVRDLGISADVTDARLDLSTPSVGGAFAAYAAVIDNVTNDPRTLLPSAASGSSTWIVPSSARIGGSGGAFYTTDVILSNLGQAEASMTLKFLGNNIDGRSGIDKLMALGAGKSAALLDVLSSVFGQESGFGAIRITSSSSNIAALSQTSTPGSGGTFGQSVPAMGLANFITQGSQRSIVGVREDSQFRTNLVLTNATEAVIEIDVSLISTDGNTLGMRRISLPPLGMTQITRVVRDLGIATEVTSARVILSTSISGGAFVAYASLIDNTTNDPVTLLPR